MNYYYILKLIFINYKVGRFERLNVVEKYFYRLLTYIICV